MPMIDTHAHVSSFPNPSQIIENALKNNISSIIDIATDLPSLKTSISLQKKYPIYTAAATPVGEKFSEKFFLSIKKTIQEKKIIAIGETGLDYFYNIPKNPQKKIFLKYLTLAEKTHLPLIIHCREAFSDVFSILKKFSLKKILFHCFTGTPQECEKIIKNGYYISFSGIITFKNADLLRKSVQLTPLEKIFLETDSPYLAPEGFRGKTNEPSYIIETFKKVAFLKNLPLQKVIEETSKNIKTFFSI